jgi:hypothetical protein
MLDRTTKLLLAVIALALCVLALRPAFTPIPAQAQDGATEGALIVAGQDVYFHFHGYVYRFGRDLTLKAQAIRTVEGRTGPDPLPTYRTLGPVAPGR